jgi:formylglycine-generating enzyme required for sulfatase activity
MLVGIIIGLVGWINQDTIRDQVNWWTKMRPYMMANFRPHQLSAAAQRALRPGDTFRECGQNCPEMVVVAAGAFTMGSPPGETGRAANESPQHKVTIAAPFAVSKYDVTFDDWEACVSVGGCPEVGDNEWGRGSRPVINVTWDDAQQYVRWLSKMTGRSYRLPTEAEWEYAARGGTSTAYPWGNDPGTGNANCVGCGGEWDNRQKTSPVGFFRPNGFGLYDMTGNVWQWVQDCYHLNYTGAPTDGSAWESGGDCDLRVDRGGSWNSKTDAVRVAYRSTYTQSNRNYSRGFRIATTLTP